MIRDSHGGEMWMLVLWFVTPCERVGRYQNFGGALPSPYLGVCVLNFRNFLPLCHFFTHNLIINFSA
jgi:hypothetical protein